MPRAFAVGNDQLVEAERLIRDRMACLDLDFPALAAVSNIFRAATAVRNHMEREVLAGHTLSWSAFVVLFVLRVFGRQESRDLAAEAGITGGTLTGVLDTLERKGLIERRAHPDDRRRVVVDATPAGLTAVDEIMPVFNEQERKVTRDLADDETAELARLLRVVTRSAEGPDRR